MNEEKDNSLEGEGNFFKEEPATDTQKNYKRTVRLTVLCTLILVFGFLGGMQVGAATGTNAVSRIPLIGDGLNATPDGGVSFDGFWKVYNVLNERFVETQGSSSTPTLLEKQWGAIVGLTASYGDPYTVFFPPEDAKLFQEDIKGNFSGIGVEIGLTKEGILTVIAPLKGTPGEAAGMLAGDLILSIDGASTKGLSTDEAVKLIRGEKGTTVTFNLYREGKNIEISVVRDTIEVPTIKNGFNSDNGVYTIELYQFTSKSSSLFESALKDFRASSAKKLIIDLRGNPGGYLESSVRIASHFLPKGAVVVTEDYKGKEDNNIHRSYGIGGVPEGTNIVVLINQGSASASEILAGALQDAGKATLIGTRSFGKGSVQELIDVEGGALKVTVARWLTPGGKSISDGGLTPDIVVPRTSEDVEAKKDPQMDRAVEFLVSGK